MKIVKDIVKQWLKAHGYGGLCSEDCGCEIDDLFCCDCGTGVTCCKAGYKHLITQKELDDDNLIIEGKELMKVGDWYISSVNPRKEAR